MAKSKNLFFLKQSHQVIYGIILIVLIPIFIVFNTLRTVDLFRDNIDISLQRQAFSLARMFDSAIYQGADDIDDAQEKIDLIQQSNPSLDIFNIYIREGDEFKLVAGFDEASIGQTSNDLNYVISWHREDDSGTATIISKEGSDKRVQRFWELAVPLHNLEGDRDALLVLNMSLKVMDDLVADSLWDSGIFIVITLLVVVLLLILNTRLFEHAILFRKLKEVDKMKDEFISIASHELRTPITTIKGFLSMAQEGDYGQLNEAGEKGFKIMEASVNRLGNLVEDLLNVSRIEQNRLVIKPKPIDTKEILNSLADEFDLRIGQKGLQFKRSFDDDLPQIWVDEDKFRQVVINLLGNAVKYTKKGEIELIAKKESDNMLTVTVKDSGIGMSAEERKSLFEKFYRIQGEETRGIIGTGLGLWITKQIVELMGGQIFVDSIKHVGSQFYFTVPIYDSKIHKVEEKKENKK
ncbi:hypothetical protein C0580_04785 [Candidatus Parcubacteria bacterium]|nr:MAG: hypothetical protein C0580_04785 [Candidatus Parcubacteria bacterium]